MRISTWGLLAALSMACADATVGIDSGRSPPLDAAGDGDATAGDAAPVDARLDAGVLGPQCAAMAACCPAHLDQFASLADCEDFAARQGEGLCEDQRRAGWCAVDAGSLPDA